MSMNLRQLDQLRRRQLRILGTNTGLRNSLTYASQARTGVALCFGQTWELVRRILLVHFIRGPTCIFAMLLSLLMIAGSAFWPTVGLLVISDSESSLMGRTTIESDFPVNMPKWYVGYDGSQPDSELQAVGRKLLAHLSHIQRVPSDEHWCGMFLNCSEHVYLGIDPTKTGVLYPRNPYYVILVRRVFGDIFGYHIYLPYKTFHTTATATKIFLPMKEQVDNFFLEANRKSGATPFSTRIRLQVAATKRDIYAESPERWSMGKGGKLFIISVMSAHQYLSTACLVVCFASIMCLDKETGFRPLMALMGMRRVSYLLAHFLICQVGVLILAACGTFVHMALGTELTDRQPIQSDYGTMFGTNVIISWHQFGIGLILCSLTRSTRSVMFPLLALFASLVLGQLVMINRVLEDVLWQRESSIDENGYLIPSYALASLHIQILNKAMISKEEEHVAFYVHTQLVLAAVFMLLGIYLDCVLNSGTGHKFDWDFPIVFCKMCFHAVHGKAERERLPSIFFKGNTNRSIDRLVEESKLQFTRVWLNGVTKDYTRWRGFRRSTFRAVTNVDLLLQKGEIAAILGHNGAGKTTIFNILAGLLPATDGRICIFGKNPLDAWDAINLRKITGVCTQFDVLDDRMTCWEHMRLMGAIKGLNRSETESETFKLFHQLELESYTITATSLLPGGDKRKLSVAMALIGSPRLIMLDEPTSGVDPFSRRCIWRVLRNYRPNRVIVLITHYMDEADILADRKAIMIGGRLVCHGTSKFLKEHYNPGYLLNMIVQSPCSTAAVKQFLCERVPGVSFVRSFNDQITFFIQANMVAQVSRLLFSVEGQKELQACCVCSFGFSVTSLEEIFLKLSEEPAEIEDAMQLAIPSGERKRPKKSKATARLRRLTQPLSIRSWQERRSIDVPSPKVPLISPKPRSEIALGMRQFSLLLRVLLGLLILPTPVYILVRSFLSAIVVALSAIVYYVETTKMPSHVTLKEREYMTRTAITGVRQHISIAYPVDKHGNWSPLVNTTVFTEDVNCLRVLLGPTEPYIREVPFDLSTSPTGLSEDSTDVRYDYNRSGSTRYDVEAWQTDWINITLVLGRHDDGLCQQIILHHTALWNCMHTRSLKSQGTLTPDISSALWIADVSSWESQWPEKHPQLKLGTACIYLIACNVAYCILSPLIAGDLVREKELRILGQLHLYGMKSWAYWGAHFSTHIFQYLMLACFTTIVMFPFKGHILSSWQNVVLHNWINSLAAFDNIVTIYLFCMFFQSAGGATVLFGSTVMIVIFVNITIYFIPLHMLEAAYGTILFVFPFADPFLTLLLTDFRIRLEKVYLFSTTRAKYVPSLWRLLQYNHVKISQIVHSFRIIIMGVMFVGINIFTHQITPKRKERLYYEGLHRLQPLSELVRQQRTDIVQDAADKVIDFVRKRRIEQNEKEDKTVAFAYKLTKYYFFGPLSLLSRFLIACKPQRNKVDENTKVAISDVSFMVNCGEIFGVLGPSGSGKSTLLECFATVTQQDLGQAGVVNRITNQLLPNQKAVEQGAIGFCPQHNPIWPHLTVREHLVIYSVMRGLQQEAIEAHVAGLISLVNMERYRDTYAGSLSGGCKRRLSMAIGLVGDPSLVIMDEPSCGVDPRSRRNLWRTLLNCFKGSDRGCIVTTHFIDEGESLCDQLAILVNGRMLSKGTPNFLKQSCSRGLFIEVKMARNYNLMPDEADYEVCHNSILFRRYLRENLPNIRVVDQFEERISLQVDTSTMALFETILKMLLQAHQSGAIEDFSVSSPTLEHAYFELAKTQLRGTNSMTT